MKAPVATGSKKTSRRDLLKAGAGVAAAGASLPLLSDKAKAQSADADLDRLCPRGAYLLRVASF
jgi:anaerobic selenocysteine-containing dehydrogenase